MMLYLTNTFFFLLSDQYIFLSFLGFSAVPVNPMYIDVLRVDWGLEGVPENFETQPFLGMLHHDLFNCFQRPLAHNPCTRPLVQPMEGRMRGTTKNLVNTSTTGLIHMCKQGRLTGSVLSWLLYS